MKEKAGFGEVLDFFSTENIDDVVIIRFKGNLLLSATDLNARDSLLEILDRIERSDSIKMVIIVSPLEKVGRQELFEFYLHIFKSKMGIGAIHRMLNIVDQVILKIVGLNKIVIHANRGEIITLLLNLSLACDYRIIADNTIFQNPYIELGTIPKGGSAFFLSKMMGTRKAARILMSGRDISASEALTLGIVDEIVPLASLEESALKTAQNFCRKPASSLTGVKQLINYQLRNLKAYLELENQALLKIIRTPDLNSDFWKKIEASRHIETRSSDKL